MTASQREAAERLRTIAGALSTAAVARIEADRPWFRDLSAQERAWVGQIVQAGVRSFVEWFDQASATPAGEEDLVVSVFGSAPRRLAGVIDLRQTVDLVRLTIDEVDGRLDQMLPGDAVAAVHPALLRYGREVAFATAEVYARAAEVRGAWDARLEALVVDSVLRSETDEAVLSRASAVGWAGRGPVAVVVGPAPEGQVQDGVFEAVRRAARDVGADALCAVQGHLLVVILGGIEDAERSAAAVSDVFGPGPVVVGPVVADLGHAQGSAAAALAGLRAAPGWPEAPRPVLADDLVAERALAGDDGAHRALVERVYRPLAQSRGALVETLSAYFGTGGGIEPTARALFVHANTVRYRLGQITELTGYSPSAPREALVLRLALVLGRQEAALRTSL